MQACRTRLPRPADDPDLPLLPRTLPPEAAPHLAALAAFVTGVRELTAASASAGSTAATGPVFAALAGLLAEPEDRPDAAAEDAAKGSAASPAAAAAAIAAARDLAGFAARSGAPRRPLRAFLAASRREAEGWRPATWDEVLAHGDAAAASLARYGLAVIGGALPAAGGGRGERAGGESAGSGSDGGGGDGALAALAIAVWLLRQVRDIDRRPAQPPLAIPSRFFADAMITPQHLRLAAARGQVRAVLDRVVDGIDRLLLAAAPLPRRLAPPELARHAAVVLCCGRALAARLRAEDPLVRPVRLGTWTRRRCLALALLPLVLAAVPSRRAAGFSSPGKDRISDGPSGDAPVTTTKRNDTMAFELPPLPYAKDALEPHISARTLEFHHGKHHAAYVTNLNNLIKDSPLAGQSLEEIIQGAHGDPGKAGVFNNAAQVWNHTFYWNCMKPGGGGAPTGDLAQAIERGFGSFEKFRDEFKNACVTQFGSGWGWLVAEKGALRISKTSNAELPMTSGQTALLTCDVWEHAYYLDFQNRRPDYVQMFLDHLVNWDFVAANLRAA